MHKAGRSLSASVACSLCHEPPLHVFRSRGARFASSSAPASSSDLEVKRLRKVGDTIIRAIKQGDRRPGWNHTKSRDGELRRLSEDVKSKPSPASNLSSDLDELHLAVGPDSESDIGVGSFVEQRGYVGFLESST